MQTIDLECGARNKTKIIADVLDGLAHIPDALAGLRAYHAAKATNNGNLRVGVDRRCTAVKKALKQFNVMVSIAHNRRDIPTVRIFAPTKQIEIYL